MVILPTSSFRALKTALQCHKDMNPICIIQREESSLSICVSDLFQFTQYHVHIHVNSETRQNNKEKKHKQIIQTSIDLDSKETQYFSSLLQTSVSPLQLSFENNTKIDVFNPNTHVLLITLPFVEHNQEPFLPSLENNMTTCIELTYITDDLIKTLLNLSVVNSIVQIRLKHGTLSYQAQSEDGTIQISKSMKTNVEFQFESTIGIKYVNTLRNLLHALKTCKMILHPESRQVDCFFRMEANCFCRFSFCFYPYYSQST